MSEKNIKIDNSGGGVINIFYDGAPPIFPIEAQTQSITPKESDKDIAIIRMASMDRYSSPLEAQISLSPWGEDGMYKVSLLVRNELIGQVIQQNHLVFSNKNNARKTFNSIVDLMDEFKKKAESGLVHSMILSQQMRNSMSKFQGDLAQPESSDLLARQPAPDSSEALATGLVPGLLMYDHEHFPTHGDLVRKASKNNSNNLIKIAENIDSSFSNKIGIKDSIIKICNIMFYDASENEEISLLKRTCLAHIRPLLSNFKTKDENWLNGWVESNPMKIKAATDLIYAFALKQFADMKEPDKIDVRYYDLFIFDADQTIWDSPIPAGQTVGPYEFKDKFTLIDSQGNAIVLKPKIKTLLKTLKEMDKDLGLISKSEKEGIPFEEQPVLQLLKKFSLLYFFNELIVIDRDIPKSAFIPTEMNQKHILFIDDKNENLIDVNENTDADVMNVDSIEHNASFSGSAFGKKIIAEHIQSSGKMASETMDIDGKEYVVCPHDCGDKNSTGLSGSMAAAWEVKKRDGETLIPKSRVKELKETCKSIKEDLKKLETEAHFNGWYKIATKWEMIEEGRLTTDEGNFVEYSVLADTKKPIYNGPKTQKRAGTIVVHEGDDGFTIRNILLADDIQRHGIGTEIYNKINEMSLLKTGKPLMSSKPRKIESTGEVLTNLSPASNGLWNKFIEKGTAIREEGDLGEFYKFKEAKKLATWYKQASSEDYVPAEERPKKPKGKGWELDHKTPKWKHKNPKDADKKSNLHWIKKDKHKAKTKSEGSFAEGGDKKQRKLKNKGEFSDYQSGAAKEKMKQEKDKLGDKGFSDLQRKRVQKRWNKKKSANETWYKVASDDEVEKIKNEISSFIRENIGDEQVFVRGIIFTIGRKIGIKKIDWINFYNNEWGKIKNWLTDYLSQEPCTQSVILPETLKIGEPCPVDYFHEDEENGEKQLLVAKGEILNENNLAVLVEAGYARSFFTTYFCDDPDLLKTEEDSFKRSEAVFDDKKRTEAYKKIVDFIKSKP